ncbi:MAG TPA: (4Fe-4S)-binding protein [Blastocatellia bacterium]|nr:(4Fe-4S)-binding protein [Blastocatellia bacterium]
MEEIIKKYSNGEVTVVWQPAKCIHSTICYRELPEVFDPNKRPWVNALGATTEKIVAQVRRCPSGALSFFLNSGDEIAEQEPPMQISGEVVPNGPILIHGRLTLKLKNGEEVVKTGTTAFCRCGGSSNPPFCDGTHSTIGFKDE